MLFKVVKRHYYINNIRRNTAYLIIDDWDDWFTYSTMYRLKIVDDEGIIHNIGYVKIGEFDMVEEQRRPNIPEEFYTLDDKFFSLGQSDYYYEKLNKLGNEIRQQVLSSLNDFALNNEILNKAIDEKVTTTSLLRSVTSSSVKGQFRRIANGGARLTEYSFNYTSHLDTSYKSMELSFDVIPESNPPTNIHVIIGRNGVGKTRLIKNMISALLYDENPNEIGAFCDESKESKLFTNIICIAFSAFDEISSISSRESVEKPVIPFFNIGLPLKIEGKERGNQLVNSFVESMKQISFNAQKVDLWKDSIATLESDPIFKEANIKELIIDKTLQDNDANKKFIKLSSGHKVILLTITKLVETVEEKSLIFFDEPEGHLHPPLLSAFVRALSELLINRNGVAIIATHSPVVLQEVPKSCVWKLRRHGNVAISERLDIESFGENIDALTRAIFGLEVTYAGFHKLLLDAVKKYNNYDSIIDHFNNELGMEARGIIKALLAINESEGNG